MIIWLMAEFNDFLVSENPFQFSARFPYTEIVSLWIEYA